MIAVFTLGSLGVKEGMAVSEYHCSASAPQMTLKINR
jgi:hypothetical protein